MADNTLENTSLASPVVGQVLELGPLVNPRRNKYGFACAILASITSIVVGYDTGVMSGAMIFIQEDLYISDSKIQILAGIISIYSLIGSLVAPRTSDWIGRRYTIFLSGITLLVGSLLMGFATNYAFLMFGRFIAGIGFGYALVIAPVYTVEVSPTCSRGFLTSIPEVFISVGTLFGYISSYTFSTLPLNLGWRFMLGIGAIPSLFLAVGAFWMPESPRWLVMQGRLDDAKLVLDKTSESLAQSTLRLEDIKTIAGISADSNEEIDEESWTNNYGVGVWKKLLLHSTPSVRRIVIAVIALNFFQQASGVEAMRFYAPRIFETVGLKTDSQQLLATIAVGVVETIFILVATYLLDRIGRRPLLLSSFGGIATSLITLGLAMILFLGGDEEEQKVIWAAALSIAMLMTCVAAFSIGAGPVTSVYCSEIFPSKLRSQGESMSSVVNDLTNAAISMSFLSLSNAMSTGGTLLLFGGLSITACQLIYKYLPETQGKRLEDMDALFNSFTEVTCIISPEPKLNKLRKLGKIRLEV